MTSSAARPRSSVSGSSRATTLDDLLPEAFAAVREASKRTLGMRHFDVQLLGGAVLHEGSIAEMRTGEGKTLAATLPVYLNALPAEGVHLVTVNDYLARRDAEWMRPVYEALGLTVGVIQADQDPADRRAQYECDITYGTNSEFGFDYLRDNLATDIDQCVQRRHAYAIVDEVDSILIDEARTPLIISGSPEEAPDTYYTFAKIAPHAERPRRLRGRREAQVGRAERAGRAQGRARAQDREPVLARERPARQPPRAGAQGRVAVQARRRVRGARRRGQDHRRVHRPHHGGPALVGGPAPGRRGEGGREDRGRERHGRDDHDPELLPPVRQARRHDGHGADRGERVPRDLQARRHPDPDEPAHGADGSERLHLQDARREVRGGDQRHLRAPREGPARPRRHHLRRGVGVPLGPARAPRHHAQRPERQAARARGRDHQGRGPGRRGHDRDEHGRPRCRHQARRRGARSRRPVHPRHRAPRVAAHRQPAARPRRTPGRSGRVALLPLRRGRPRAPVRGRSHLHDPRQARPRRGRADRAQDAHQADRGRAEEGRGAELRDPQERPQVRRRAEPSARRRLRRAA